MRKFIIAACAVLIFALFSLSACGQSAQTSAGDVTQKPAAEKPLTVVTTIFPAYDWTRQVVGDAKGVQVDMLLDSGVDLHSYQPTAQDIKKISDCDVFVYVGGESDKWVDDVLAQANNPNMRVVNLMDELGDAVVEEKLVEGMQEEEEADAHQEEGLERTDTAGSANEESAKHEEDGEKNEHEENGEADEHVWLSLRNAQTLVSSIESALADVDPDNAQTYADNADAYRAELEALDARYSDTLACSRTSTLLVADRFPFRYLADDYGINYFAAFPGCSAESNASFETVVFLAGKVDELGLSAIAVIDGSDRKIADAVIENVKGTRPEVVELNSMQSVTASDVEAGATYLGIMEDNLGVLAKALA